MILSNCGSLGLDWERISLSGYLEALDAHNAAFEKSDRDVQVSDWMRGAMRAGVWN